MIKKILYFLLALIVLCIGLVYYALNNIYKEKAIYACNGTLDNPGNKTLGIEKGIFKDVKLYMRVNEYQGWLTLMNQKREGDIKVEVVKKDNLPAPRLTSFVFRFYYDTSDIIEILLIRTPVGEFSMLSKRLFIKFPDYNSVYEGDCIKE